MQNNPRFSVIIPVYNVAPYLHECLSSVLAQSFTDWEAICVDDGSTDESGKILDAYAAKDGRFRVIHQKNAGVSASRNAALDMVRGEWIGFLDADDAWSNDWLSMAVKGFCPNVQAVVMGGLTVLQPGVALPEQTSVRDPQIRRFKGVKGVWQVIAQTTFPCLWFLNREVVRQERFCNGLKLLEDAAFLMNVARFESCVAVVDFDGYYYRQRCGSASHVSYNADQIKIYLQEVRRALDAYNYRTKRQIAESVSFKLKKDIRGHLLRMNSEGYEKERQHIHELVLGFVGEGLLKASGSVQAPSWGWALYLRTGNRDYLRVAVTASWLKLIPYWCTGDHRWLWDTRRKLKEIFK